jgi:hypothetical protein
MDQKIDERVLAFKRKRGAIYFSVFVILIILGIILKRVYSLPEYMMLFHGPAAVFLILAGLDFTFEQRLIYIQKIAAGVIRR